MATGALDRLQSLAFRIQGRLAALAEAVETRLAGLAPLPEPPGEDAGS